LAKKGSTSIVRSFFTFSDLSEPVQLKESRLIAQEWSDRLDSLFKIDSGLDTRLHTVEEKWASWTL